MKILNNNKELIVRKRVSGFIEKLFRYFGYDFHHDIYKNVVYAESGCMTKFDEKAKAYYDAYNYLISNHKNVITKTLLSKFLYLMFGRIFDDNFLISLSSRCFRYNSISTIEEAIELHLIIYKEMNEFTDEERTFVSLMFLNFGLLKVNNPTIHLCYKNLTRYFKLRETHINNGDNEIYKYLYEYILSAKYQEKTYYKNLVPLTLADIKKSILEDEEMLKSKYKIKHILVFGSFAKNLNRIDSDIDLMFTISLDYTLKEKIEIVKYLEEYYFNKFKRYVDFSELSELLSEEFIKENKTIIKIF